VAGAVFKMATVLWFMSPPRQASGKREVFTTHGLSGSCITFYILPASPQARIPVPVHEDKENLPAKEHKDFDQHDDGRPVAPHVVRRHGASHSDAAT